MLLSLKNIDTKCALLITFLNKWLINTNTHSHFFNSQAYLKAAGARKNIHKELLTNEAQRQLQLVPNGPRVVKHTTNTQKTIDTEDTNLRCLAQPDGTLVTETQKTTEHEELVDAELPDSDDHSTGSRDKVEQKVSLSNVTKFYMFILIYVFNKNTGILATLPQNAWWANSRDGSGR